MSTLIEYGDWLTRQNLKPFERVEICQCGTEKAILRSEKPERMRAVFLLYVFLDQFIFTHFPQAHEAFKASFSGPKLCGHSDASYASPSWFVYSRRGYDSKANWATLTEIFKECLVGSLNWLRENFGVDEDRYWKLVANEIGQEFEIQHHSKLLATLPSNAL